MPRKLLPSVISAWKAPPRMAKVLISIYGGSKPPAIEITDEVFRAAVTAVHRRYGRAAGAEAVAWNRWLDLKRSRPGATARLGALRRAARGAEKETEKRLHELAWTVSELRGLLSDVRNPLVRARVKELLKGVLKRPKKARKVVRR